MKIICTLCLWRMALFCVQLHGVPSFYMTIVVSQAIGAMLGDVIQVDNRDGSDCKGRFIRNRVQFDVTLPLIRQAPVTFPEAGEKMVEFIYEYLPNYCFACGRLGHSTQACLKKYESINGPLTPSLCDQLYSAFGNLEGITNLWGKPISSVALRSSAFPPPFRGTTTFSQHGLGDHDSPNDRFWRSHSCDRDEFTDHLLPLYHIVIGVWRPLIFFIDRLVSLLMKFTPRYHLHRSRLGWSWVLFPWIFPQGGTFPGTPCTIGGLTIVQVVGAPSGSVVSPSFGATSQDCVSPDLFDPFALMPISEGLPKKKGRGRPKK